MLLIPSLGLTELVVLAGVAGLACGVPLIGALVVAAIVLRRRAPYPVEQG